MQNPQWTARFFIGCILALVSGIVNNLGTLWQKRAVNAYVKKQAGELTLSGEIMKNEKLSSVKMSMKELMLEKTWLTGFISQLVVATALFIGAQVTIGPTLTPAIGSFGLVVLVFASCIVQEKLGWDEYLGIFIMTAAVFLLALSDLEIDASTVNFLGSLFMMRVAIYTSVIVVSMAACYLWSLKKDKFEGTVLALLSGLCIALSNFWVSPLTAIIQGALSHKGNPTINENHTAVLVLYTLFAVAVVIGSNVLAIYERQYAFRVGHASTMIPISHIPSHLSAPLIYSLVFWKTAPTSYSLACVWIGIVLLLVSSFIFGKREAMFEQKQKVADVVSEDSVPLVVNP